MVVVVLHLLELDGRARAVPKNKPPLLVSVLHADVTRHGPIDGTVVPVPSSQSDNRRREAVFCRPELGIV